MWQECMNRSMGLKPTFICIALFMAGYALAQDQKPDDQRTRDQKALDQKTPEQKQADANQTYEGPSILSRDKSLIGERGGKLIDFRFYGEVTGIYDSGLTPVATDQQGNLIHVGGSEGMEAGFGVIGARKWRRDKLSLEYKGSYRHYFNQKLFSGADQFLNLAFAHALKRRLTLDLKETVGTSTLSNGSFAYLPLTNTDLFAVPANELFDSRTNFLQSRVDLTWQKSARLSIGLGGEGFLVRRASLALAGLNGYSARANVGYRVTRRQTISANYNYSYFAWILHRFEPQVGFQHAGRRRARRNFGFDTGIARSGYRRDCRAQRRCRNILPNRLRTRCRSTADTPLRSLRSHAGLLHRRFTGKRSLSCVAAKCGNSRILLHGLSKVDGGGERQL